MLYRAGMSKRDLMETLASRTHLTFGGNETYLLFLQQFPLREFCAFEVAGDEPAWRRMEDALLRPILDAAAANGHGILTDCMVWRASTDYVERLGHGEAGVRGVNERAVARTRRTIDDWRATSDAARSTPVLVAADVGPRGDGYAVGVSVTAELARDYHAPQIEALAASGVDLIVALTMTNLAESIGLVRAADRAGVPILVSPTVEVDGRIPDGTTLRDFIATIDDATAGSPIGYIANCAHPTHLEPTLREAGSRGEPWLARFRGLRANASDKTHVELDNSTEIDRGEPADLARRLGELRQTYGFTIVGGCCGTDAEHLAAIARSCR